MFKLTRKQLIAAPSVLGLFAVALFLLWPGPDPGTRATYDRIQNGMTESEVEAVVGLPPGDYATAPTEYDRGTAGFEEFKAIPGLVQWSGDEGTILVGFDFSWRVAKKAYWPAVGKTEKSTLRSWLRRLRRRFVAGR